jgi:hypothetical protein
MVPPLFHITHKNGYRKLSKVIRAPKDCARTAQLSQSQVLESLDFESATERIYADIEARLLCVRVAISRRSAIMSRYQVQ